LRKNHSGMETNDVKDSLKNVLPVA